MDGKFKFLFGRLRLNCGKKLLKHLKSLNSSLVDCDKYRVTKEEVERSSLNSSLVDCDIGLDVVWIMRSGV